MEGFYDKMKKFFAEIVRDELKRITSISFEQIMNVCFFCIIYWSKVKNPVLSFMDEFSNKINLKINFLNNVFLNVLFCAIFIFLYYFIYNFFKNRGKIYTASKNIISLKKLLKKPTFGKEKIDTMYFEKPIEFYFKKVSKNVITSDEKFKLECAELEKHDHVFFSKFSKRFYSYFNNSYTYHNNKYHFVNEFLKIYMENYQKEEISKTNDKQNNLLMEKFIRNFHKLVHLHDDVFFFHLSVFMANEKRYKYIYIKASEELMKKIKQYNKQSVYKTNFITEVVELKWDTTKINKNLKVNNEIYKVDFSLQLKPKNNKISQQSQQEKSPFNPIITLTPNKNKEGGLQSDFWERNEQLTLIEKEAVVLKIKTKDGKDKNIIKSLGIQGEIKTLFTIKFNPAKKDVQIYFEKPSSVTFQTPIFQVGK